MGIIILQILAIEQNSPLRGLIKFYQQIDNGTFTCATQADQRGNSVAPNAKADILLGLVAVGINKIHVLKFDITLYRRRIDTTYHFDLAIIF